MTGALLPEGFRDRLPPAAEAAARVLHAVVDTCTAHGYDRVQPPLVEYEAGLMQWLGKTGDGTLLFRASDPHDGAAVGLRPDITGQIARIAATRLGAAPRPLRLAYAGQVLRARAGQIDPARERTQVGAELIGADSVAAVREVLLVAIEALAAAGVGAISVDLTLPELVPALAYGPWPVPDPDALAAALDAKDAGSLAALGGERYRGLLEAAGPAGTAIARLRALGIGTGLVDRLEALVIGVPGVRITIDPTERHGFEYQSWIGFSLFGAVAGAPARTEIGRGGAYLVRHPDGTTEAACGFSLYTDALVDAGLGVVRRDCVFLPWGTAPDIGRTLRAAGHRTIAALSPDDEGPAATHRWTGSEIVRKG